MCPMGETTGLGNIASPDVSPPCPHQLSDSLNKMTSMGLSILKSYDSALPVQGPTFHPCPSPQQPALCGGDPSGTPHIFSVPPQGLLTPWLEKLVQIHLVFTCGRPGRTWKCEGIGTTVSS